MLASLGKIACGQTKRIGALRPWVWPLIVVALLLGVLYGLSPNFRVQSSPTASPYAGDFLQEWLGGNIVRLGDHGRFYDAAYARELQHDPNLIGFRWDESRYLPIVYPPFYYAAISPLSHISVQAAAWIWAALMVGCFVAAGVLLLSMLKNRMNAATTNLETGGWRRSLSDAPAVTAERPGGRSLQLLPWLLPAALFFMPLLESLTSSQKGTVCLLILTGTYLLLDSKRPFTAGLFFGLLAFKPQLTLVIAFAMLFKGQWRFVLGGAITGLVLGGVSLTVGLDVCRQYLAFSTGATEYLHTSGYDLSKSHCLYGFFALLNGGEATLGVKLATLAALAVVVAMLGYVLRGGVRPGDSRFALQFSALVVASLLASPHLFTYDLTILLLPMFLIGTSLYSGAIPSERRNLFGWLLAALFALAGLSPAIAAQTGVQVTTLLMVGLLVLLAQCSRHTPCAVCCGTRSVPATF